MSTIINILKNINPLKEIKSNSKVEYVVQKLLAFLLIYFSAALLMEVVVIFVFNILGYNLLSGEMPRGVWVDLLPLYGFIGFAVLTILYVRIIEKRSLSFMMLEWNLYFLKILIKNFFIGIILVSGIVAVLFVSENYTFIGLGDFNITVVAMSLLAYIIQGSAEELMCRGFLQNSLSRRVGVPLAIAISSIVFAIPHLSSLNEINKVSFFIAIINLILVSFLFSLAMIKDNSIGAACGIHVGWNFFLSIVCGLQVSGGKMSNGIIQFAVKNDKEWLTGGSYGIEASVLLIPILVFISVAYVYQMNRKSKGKSREYGI